MPSQPCLARRLTTADAVVVGLSAMLGAGVFAVWAPAAAAAGSGLLLGLGVAAIIAFCNAVASAQLAAVHPASGGTYVFGRRVLGPWWGFIAGWGFVVGKTASCAAMAMTFAAYTVPFDGAAGDWWQRGVAASAVSLLTLANLRGVTRTAAMARVLLAVTLLVLTGLIVVLIVMVVGHGQVSGAPLLPSSGSSSMSASMASSGALGVLQSAGLLFFAFAGYARIATLAEEVRRPEVLGQAILISLSVAVALYAAIGWLVVTTLGEGLATSTAPLAEATQAVGAGWAVPVVRLGAATAALGALLALLAGVGRTTLAMARERDLPATLGSVSTRHHVPDHAQVTVGLTVIALVLVLDLRGAIGFSSLGVLVYYFVSNAAAFAQPRAERRWPQVLQLLGMLGCVTLVVTLPWQSVIAGIIVFAVGITGRLFARRHRSGRGR